MKSACLGKRKLRFGDFNLKGHCPKQTPNTGQANRGKSPFYQLGCNKLKILGIKKRLEGMSPSQV